MWELDHKEGWVLKNWYFWTMVLEKALKSLLDFKDIKSVHPKGNPPWIFIWSTDAETVILWLPGAKSQFIGKDPDAGKDWGQEEKVTTEDETVGWHHWLNGHKFEQTPWGGEGQGSLVCCCPWVTNSQMWLGNWTTAKMNHDKWIETNEDGKLASQVVEINWDGKARKNSMEKTNQNYVTGGTERDCVHLNLKPKRQWTQRKMQIQLENCKSGKGTSVALRGQLLRRMLPATPWWTLSEATEIKENGIKVMRSCKKIIPENINLDPGCGRLTGASY